MRRAGETWQMRCQQVHRAGAGVGTARASDKVCCQASAARGRACKSIAVAWGGQQSWQGRLQVITQPMDMGRAATGPSGEKKITQPMLVRCTERLCLSLLSGNTRSTACPSFFTDTFGQCLFCLLCNGSKVCFLS